jgi:hypothetical protein
VCVYIGCTVYLHIGCAVYLHTDCTVYLDLDGDGDGGLGGPSETTPLELPAHHPTDQDERDHRVHGQHEGKRRFHADRMPRGARDKTDKPNRQAPPGYDPDRAAAAVGVGPGSGFIAGTVIASALVLGVLIIFRAVAPPPAGTIAGE